jgi:hypothetical protein
MLVFLQNYHLLYPMVWVRWGTPQMASSENHEPFRRLADSQGRGQEGWAQILFFVSQALVCHSISIDLDSSLHDVII